MATKITTGLIANDAITSAHIGATAITHADLHTNMDLTGKTVLVANASTGDNDTTAANTAFVQQELAALVDSAPGTLNTLNELAAALGDDAAFSTTVTNSIATKIPLAGGTFTGNVNITKETPYLNLTDSSASRTLGVFVDDNNSVLRSSGPLLLQVGSSSAITIDTNLRVFIGDATGANTSALNVTGQNGEQAIVAQVENNAYSLFQGFNASDALVTQFTGAGVFTHNGSFDINGSGDISGAITTGAISVPSGNVGIGETSPLGKIHAKVSDTGASASAQGNLLVLEDTENGMSILSGTSGAGYILFGDSGDNDIGGILYDHSANAMRFRTNGNWDVLRITSDGDVGIGTANPFGTTSNRTCFSVNGTSSVSLNIGVGNAQKGYMYTDGNLTQFGSVGAIPLKFAPNDQPKMTLDTNGDITISSGSVSTAIDQFQNNAITSTTSSGASWTLTTNSGTFNTRGSLEVAGIANRHVFKWGFSGALSANTWYPFTKRSELATYGPDSGGGSEDGFAMYFRIYTYTSTSGWGEYLSNRLTNMVWVGNYGSNSVEEQHFIVGPALGHAPNGSQGLPKSGTSISPVQMRIHHRMGSNDHPNSDQTFEILVSSALTGLNATVAGRQLLIYGYVL